MSDERQRISNLVNGRLSPPRSGRWLDVHEPATGEVYALVPDSGAEDVDEAVAAAERAAPTWAATPAAERARVLNRLADLIEHDAPGFAEAESRDSGKPVALAR